MRSIHYFDQHYIQKLRPNLMRQLKCFSIHLRWPIGHCSQIKGLSLILLLSFCLIELYFKTRNTYFEIINCAFFVEYPSILPAIEDNLRSVNDIIIQFRIKFREFLRKVIFFLCKLFDINKLNWLILTKTNNLIDRFIKISLHTRIFPFISFELFSSLKIP